MFKYLAAIAITLLWVSTSQATCVANYTPVAGDNTAVLNSATALAASSGYELGLPAGIIGISGTWVWPTNFRWCGQGQNVTTIQKIAGSGTSGMLANGRAAPEMIFLNGSISAAAGNYFFHDATVDFNGLNQPSSQFYFGLIGSYISSIEIERVTFQNSLGGGMFGIVATDVLMPTVPDGQQINGPVTIRDSIFNGANQIYGQYADLVDIVSSLSVTFENNVVENNGATCLSEGFNKNLLVRHNKIINCWRGIYQETSQEFTIADNEIFWISQPVGGTSTTPVNGVWAVDANQTYVGGGYAGNKRGRVVGNHIHDIKLVTGSGGVQGVRISAPALAAQDIFIEGNTIYNNGVIDGSGIATGIFLEGAVDTIIARFNTFRSLLPPSAGVITGATYSGVASSASVQVIDNFCSGVNSCNGSVTQNCPAESDPNDSLTALLLHMQGVSGSISFPDTSISGHVMTPHGSTQITTTGSVFCGSSAAFDGATSDIETQDSSNLRAQGDYAIDFWAFPSVLGAPQNIISKPNSNWYSPYKIVIDADARVKFLASSTGVSWDIASLAIMSATPLIAQRWVHIEIDRCGTTYYPFIQGVLGVTFTSSAIPMISGDNLKIGMDRTSQFYGGELQELRFSNVCRHTANFTPPIGPY